MGAHIDTAEHALEVARAGVDVLVHGIHLSDLTVEQAAELKRLGVQVVPTISTFDHIDQLRAGSYVPSALERETEGDEVLAPFRPEVVKAQELPPGFVSWIGVLQQNRPFRQSTVKTLFDAGVTILVGSDASGSIACHPGGSLHEELGQLAQAGLPNVDILLGATSRGAALYQGTPDFGTVEVGKAADLLIVEGNPLEDLTALDRIAFVVRRGQLLERKTPPK